MLKVSYATRRSGTIRSSQLRGKLSAVLLNTQKRILKKFQRYVSTWEEHHPFFETEKGTHYAGGDIWVGISTDDKVFWWLEEGTEVRYAVMDVGFIPKTQPAQVNSQNGQGGFAYLDPLMRSRDGIEARHIGPEIAYQEEPRFRKDILTVVADINFIEGVQDILG